jgi:hypothetical protein
MGCVGKEFLECDQPVILDCVKDEHVYPMVPAGKALHEMELGEVKLTEVFFMVLTIGTSQIY